MLNDQEKRRLQNRLRTLKEAALAAPHAYRWYRSHSAILSPTDSGIKMVALADSYCLKQGHGGYPIDPTLDAPVSRYITASCPKTTLELIELVEKMLCA
jgi:hypothetical protein